MATTRRTRPGTAATPAKAKTASVRTRRGTDASQLLIIGACALLIGIVAAIGVAIGAHNDTHPVVLWLPAIPILAGIGLLFWGLAKVSAKPRRAVGGDGGDQALEPR
jgi:hypothetical protein